MENIYIYIYIYIYYTTIGLHTTINLYLHSSVLGSYDTLSNFKMDTIIKKISVRANYNELIFDSSMAGFDYLDVSRRSFQRIDFRLTDSYGKTINFKKISLVAFDHFQKKNYMYHKNK